MVPLRGDDTPTIGAPDVPPAPVAKTKAHDQGDDALFAGLVPHLQLTITSENIAKLLQNPRTLVPLTIKEVGGATYKNCSVKIKGSSGSFRPSIKTDQGRSTRTDKVKQSQKFRGCAKLQLNNCAQDNTYLHAQIAGEMARKAGIPASQFTGLCHAFGVRHQAQGRAPPSLANPNNPKPNPDPQSSSLGLSKFWVRSVDFAVTDTDPTIILELPPGTAGELWMDRSSIHLARLP